MGCSLCQKPNIYAKPAAGNTPGMQDFVLPAAAGWLPGNLQTEKQCILSWEFPFR